MCRWLGEVTQKYALDPFYHARAWVFDAGVWAAIRVTAYEIPFADVRRKKRSANHTHADLHLEAAGDLDALSARAEAKADESAGRRGAVTDKCKTLFTFNTALLALISVFQGKTSDLAAWEAVVFYAAVLAFVVALLVLWTYFDVTGEITDPLTQHDVGLNKEDLAKSQINSHLDRAADLDNRTDYLVDVYRTSRFYLMVGFCLLFLVFSHSYFARSFGSVADKVANKLKGDPKFKDMVREAMRRDD